jgi:hypothetical protein
VESGDVTQAPVGIDQRECANADDAGAKNEWEGERHCPSRYVNVRTARAAEQAVGWFFPIGKALRGKEFGAPIVI